jgi:hypothetical protein
MADDFCSLMIALLLCLLWVLVLWARRHHASVTRSSATTLRHRLLKPRTPDDCPACRRPSAHPSAASSPPAMVRPWSELKRRRGVPKRIPTDGFACPNHALADLATTYFSYMGRSAWQKRVTFWPVLKRSPVSHKREFVPARTTHMRHLCCGSVCHACT